MTPLAWWGTKWSTAAMSTPYSVGEGGQGGRDVFGDEVAYAAAVHPEVVAALGEGLRGGGVAAAARFDADEVVGVAAAGQVARDDAAGVRDGADDGSSGAVGEEDRGPAVGEVQDAEYTSAPITRARAVGCWAMRLWARARA